MLLTDLIEFLINQVKLRNYNIIGLELPINLNIYR